jgi:hypothetical protein
MGDVAMSAAQVVHDVAPRIGEPQLAGRRVLFLGAAYNPLSVACLDALAAQGAAITVAADDVLATSARGTLWRLLRTRGARAVTRRAWLVVCARVRLVMRKFGVPLRGAASLHEVCAIHGLTSVSCPDPNGSTFIELVRARRIEVIVMANYRHVLRPPLYTVPEFGAINVHPSLLPAFRGPEPIYWVLARGDRVTGVTVHQVDEGLDTGPIVAQQAFEIAFGDDERTILTRAALMAGAILPMALASLLSGRVRPWPQPVIGASYFPPAPRGASAI